MSDSIFTKIINGEIPAHRVYEDRHTLGFLDIHPALPGHTLIVSKKQIEQFTEMDDDDFQNLTKAAHTFAKHLQQTLGCYRVLLKIEGFDVPHVHINLIPCNDVGDLSAAADPNIEPDHAALAKIASKIRLN